MLNPNRLRLCAYLVHPFRIFMDAVVKICSLVDFCTDGIQNIYFDVWFMMLESPFRLLKLI